MEMNFERANGVETIELSRRPSTVSLIVAIMALLVNLQILLVVFTTNISYFLIAMLVMVGGSTAWLGLIALEAILPTRIKMDKDGITVERILGAQTYTWIDVSSAKLVPSVGMLSDDPRADPSGRLAVGLFLKGRKTPRLHELDADVMVFGASDAHLADLMRLIERITEFKATIGSGRVDRTSRIRKPAPIVAAAAFRRPRSAA